MYWGPPKDLLSTQANALTRAVPQQSALQLAMSWGKGDQHKGFAAKAMRLAFHTTAARTPDSVPRAVLPSKCCT